LTVEAAGWTLAGFRTTVQEGEMSNRIVGRTRQALGHEPAPAAHPALEPCAGCGEETATGSVFFSDRSLVNRSDRSTAYLCTLCDSRIRASRRGHRLSDEEVRKVVENGNAAGLLWGSQGF
jgi:hypothetical protein